MVDLNRISEQIISCCIKAHRVPGPGLLESANEDVLCKRDHIFSVIFHTVQQTKGKAIGSIGVWEWLRFIAVTSPYPFSCWLASGISLMWLR
ncbi:hypothetical protein ES705_30637 [subsurface metagenome]